MSDLISRKYAIDLIEGVEWWHLNRKGELVIGAPNENEALYRAKDIFDILKFMSGAKEWIPVEEELPEEEELCIVTVVGPDCKDVDVASFVTDKGYIDNHWDTDVDWIEGDENDWHVTAWMPFPKPYEKEDTE